MGYSQAIRLGGRAVSALRQYGLIEESSRQYRISDLSYTLIHFDHGSDEWRQAVVEAAKRPILFKELGEKYKNDVPSDATLRNELLNRGFNPTAVSDVITIFRNTMSLAEQAEGSYTVGEERAVMSEAAASTIPSTSAGQTRPISGNWETRPSPLSLPKMGRQSLQECYLTRP